MATCDIFPETLEETAALCNPAVRVTTHACDVSDEDQVIAFRDAVVERHQAECVHLLFNNAGIVGGGSFVAGRRDAWERTFGVCWYGVYHCTRAFLPLLVASDAACIVNTSSINGFWASVGPEAPHTAYSTAKFAVKGFSEALIADLRVHAPHVSVAVVMPGHIGTSITANSPRVQSLQPGSARGLPLARKGPPAPEELSSEEIARVRERLVAAGEPVGNAPDDHIRAALSRRAMEFRESAPTSAAEAARIILDGVRAGRWRILVGEDAHALDRMVREEPEDGLRAGVRAPRRRARCVHADPRPLTKGRGFVPSRGGPCTISGRDAVGKGLSPTPPAVVRARCRNGTR